MYTYVYTYIYVHTYINVYTYIYTCKNKYTLLQSIYLCMYSGHNK